MEQQLEELKELKNIQSDYDSLQIQFETLKTKSISLYQEKQKLDTDNKALSNLVFKYKDEKAEVLRVSQNAVSSLKEQN